MSSMAVSASLRSWAMTTPLPRASPSAFTASGNPNSSSAAFASDDDSNSPNRAVGIPCRTMKRFAKLFDDSNWAASLQGPNIRKPAFSNRSTIPAARTSSGPTTVRSIDSRCAKLSSRSISELYRDVPPDVRGSGVSGRDEDLLDSGRLTNFPGQRMFTAAAADHQNFHDQPLPKGRHVNGRCRRQLRLVSVKRFPLM